MKKRIPRFQTTSASESAKVVHTKALALPQYPFSAIVGQEEMKLGLMLNAVDPLIGGVLIMGHRGTGKSTAVRGLAELLPKIKFISGCAYRCDFDISLCAECQNRAESGDQLKRESDSVVVVDLPLGATEDRVCGTIDLEHALHQGTKKFEPGLLARANRGLLYIDEVNLLDDHLVDILLDVAVTGVNKVEREGISIQHPARFVLIGSGNPEEGDLRPQLLDRFGLQVEVTTDEDLDRRVDIVERRHAFEDDPVGFRTKFDSNQKQLQTKITRAQKNSGTVTIERPLLRQIAQLCTELKIDGHRGELTIARAARALAALDGRKKVTADEVRRVAPMALRHRLRRDPLEDAGSTERIQQALDKVFGEQPKKRVAGPGSGGQGDGHESASQNGMSETGERRASQVSRSHGKSATRAEGSSPVSLEPSSTASKVGVGVIMLGPGELSLVPRRRSKAPSTNNSRGVKSKQVSYGSLRGRYARAVNFKQEGSRIALDATLRAAASRRHNLDHKSSLFQNYDTGDLIRNLRYKQLSRKCGKLFIFAIDASGSMAINRIRHAKEAALSLLKQSYIDRDRVAIIGFRGTSAEVLLPPSSSVLRARRVLDSIGVGGGTPLGAGLIRSLEVARQDRTESEVILFIFTDGNANVAAGSNGNAFGPKDRSERWEKINGELASLGSALRKAGVKVFIVDSHSPYLSNGNARLLANKLGANYVINHTHVGPTWQITG